MIPAPAWWCRARSAGSPPSAPRAWSISRPTASSTSSRPGRRSCCSRRARRKHSQRNAELSGEFVFNLATWDLRTEMNITGSDHREDISEAELAGLEMVPCRNGQAAARRALADHARMPLQQDRRSGVVETARRIDEFAGHRRSGATCTSTTAVIVDGMIDMARIRPISRLGYMDSRGGHIFTMRRVPAHARSTYQLPQDRSWTSNSSASMSPTASPPSPSTARR